MLKREELEKRELIYLDSKACKSQDSKGRQVYEEPCEFRTEFQRDRDRIIHSKAFRRLMHKTQVFISPEGDHYRTRLTHTIEVTQIARTISRNMNLNEDLTEAIGLGHDLGHTPFGHNGEMVLSRIHEGGFRHNEQSLRVVDYLESTPSRKGMNLTYEVRNGILNHSGSMKASTLEGQIVAISDRIAYINHDIDDAIRSGVISLEDLPKSSIELFGRGHGDRINCMVKNVVETSEGQDCIMMDQTHREELDILRNFMFKNVYRSSKVKKAEDIAEVEKIITSLYDYFLQHPDRLPDDYGRLLAKDDKGVVVKDYIAGMTDRYAINLYHKLF